MEEDLYAATCKGETPNEDAREALLEMLPRMNGNNLAERRDMAEYAIEDGIYESLPPRAQILCNILIGRKENFEAIVALSQHEDLGEGRVRAYLHSLLKFETNPEVLVFAVDVLFDLGREDSLTSLFDFAKNGASDAVMDATIGTLTAILVRARNISKYESSLQEAISGAKPESRKKLELLRPAVPQRDKELKGQGMGLMRWMSRNKPALSAFMRKREERMRARSNPRTTSPAPSRSESKPQTISIGAPKGQRADWRALRRAGK